MGQEESPRRLGSGDGLLQRSGACAKAPFSPRPFQALWVPFEIAAAPFARGEWSWQELLVMLFDRLFDLIFLLDIFMNCCTAYYDRATAEWVRQHARIVMRYARFWLWIDVLSLLASIPDMIGNTVVELQAASRRGSRTPLLSCSASPLCALPGFAPAHASATSPSKLHP